MVPVRIHLGKVVIDSVERVNRILETPESKRDVKILATWYSPVFILHVIYRALNTAIDSVRYLSRNLTKPQETSSVRIMGDMGPCKPECISRVKDGNKLTARSARDNGVNDDRLTVWSNDADTRISKCLPVLI